MALFSKREERNYIVFEPYTGEVIAACTTKEVKQIVHITPKAQFVECNSYEFFKYKEHSILPDDIRNRPYLMAKDIK